MASSSQNRSLVFDEIRKSWVAATPEEIVRQRLLKVMVDQLSYPKELLSVEKPLAELPHLKCTSVPARRADLLCFGKNIHPEHVLYPLLLIECKYEEDLSGAIEQVIGYNYYVQAYFVGAANKNSIQIGYFDQMLQKYQFFSHLPSYDELLKKVAR